MYDYPPLLSAPLTRLHRSITFCFTREDKSHCSVSSTQAPFLMSTDCESISSPLTEAPSPNTVLSKSRGKSSSNFATDMESPINSPVPPHSPSSIHSNCTSSSASEHSGDATSRSSMATIESTDRVPVTSSCSLVSPVTSTASSLATASRGSALKSTECGKYSGSDRTFNLSLKREMHSDSESEIDIEGEDEHDAKNTLCKNSRKSKNASTSRHGGDSDCSEYVNSRKQQSPHQVFKRGHPDTPHHKSKRQSLQRTNHSTSNHCNSNHLDDGTGAKDATTHHTSKSSSSSSFSSSPPPMIPPKAHRSFLIDDILNRKSPDHRSQASSLDTSEHHLQQQLLTSLSPSHMSPTTLGRINQLTNQLSAAHHAAMVPIVRPWEAMIPNLQSSPVSGKRTPSAFYQRSHESASPASIAAATAAAIAAASASPSVVIPSLGHQRHSFSAYDARHVHPSLYLRRRSVSPKVPIMGKGSIRPRSADDDTVSEASSDLSEGPNNGPNGNSGSNSSATSGNGSHGDRSSTGNRNNNDNGTSPLDALFDLANKALDRVNGDKATGECPRDTDKLISK